MVSCQNTCPSGQLPFVPSLVSLNKDLFVDGVPSFPIPELSEEDKEDGFAVAIGDQQSTYMAGNSLPFQYNEMGQPVYNNELITLDCIPCL